MKVPLLITDFQRHYLTKTGREVLITAIFSFVVAGGSLALSLAANVLLPTWLYLIPLVAGSIGFLAFFGLGIAHSIIKRNYQ